MGGPHVITTQRKPREREMGIQRMGKEGRAMFWEQLDKQKATQTKGTEMKAYTFMNEGRKYKVSARYKGEGSPMLVTNLETMPFVAASFDAGDLTVKSLCVYDATAEQLKQITGDLCAWVESIRDPFEHTTVEGVKIIPAIPAENPRS